jgi:hypothetical protein
MGNKLCTRQKDTKTLNESEQCISDYVRKLLECDEINSNVIPDSMESKMYEKFLLKMVCTIKLILQDLHIEVLNHRLKIYLEPILTKKKSVATNVTVDEIQESQQVTSDEMV